MTSKTLSKMGWLCFGLMWIPFVTLMIGVMRLGPGTHPISFAVMPPLMKYSLMAVGVFFVLTFVLLFSGLVLPVLRQLLTGGRRKKRIHLHGWPAKARVLRLHETGLTLNQQPVVGFDLEVQPPAGRI